MNLEINIRNLKNYAHMHVWRYAIVSCMPETTTTTTYNPKPLHFAKSLKVTQNDTLD